MNKNTISERDEEELPSEVPEARKQAISWFIPSKSTIVTYDFLFKKISQDVKHFYVLHVRDFYVL